MKKKCPVCRLEKPLEEFNAQGKCCRVCHNERNRQWRKKHPREDADARQRYAEKFKVEDDALLICSGCKEGKEARFFGWKNKKERIRANLCRECQSKVSRAHYLNNKDKYIKRSGIRWRMIRRDMVEKVLSYLRCHPCVDCGENRPLRLEFDHVRGKKSFDISTGLRRKQRWSCVLKEIEKCDVRCSNCHAEKTARERKTLMWQIIACAKS